MAVMVTDVARAMESLVLEPMVVSVAAICLVSILMNIIQFLNALESMWSFSSRVIPLLRDGDKVMVLPSQQDVSS